MMQRAGELLEKQFPVFCCLKIVTEKRMLKNISLL